MNKFDFSCSKSVTFMCFSLYDTYVYIALKGTLQSLSHISVNEIFLFINDAAELTEDQKKNKIKKKQNNLE